MSFLYASASATWLAQRKVSILEWTSNEEMIALIVEIGSECFIINDLMSDINTVN